MTDPKNTKPVIVTGLSGAGISSVLKTLEDFRFEVFDNFPLSLIPELYNEKHQPQQDKNIAIGVDTRTRGFSPQAVLDMAEDIDASLVFITCDDRTLHKRFTETRRRHPLAQDEPLEIGIKKERELLAELQKQADLVIDSTETSIHDLRHILEGHFDAQAEENLTISLMSFGFRNGAPRGADIVMDVRFLKNPHWDKDLKPKTGLDAQVGAYIRQDQDFEDFLAHLKALLEPLFPRYAQEGKSYLTIAIGCTGGKHRSVFTVEQLKNWLEEKGWPVYVDHRDMPQSLPPA